MCPAPVRLAALLALLATLGCEAGEDECEGPRIEAVINGTLNFGDLPAAGAGARASSPDSVPFRKTVILRSTCGGQLAISRVCVIGDDHNGAEGDNAFEVEGPDRAEIGSGREAAVRITYDHPDANRDANTDGERDADQAALVIESNAKNTPILIVPLCGRIIDPTEAPQPLECDPPIRAADSTLCN